MARLPIYNNQANIEINRGVNIENVNTPLYQAVDKFGRTVQDLAVEWQKTQNAAEALDGKNKVYAEISDIMNEAENFNDWNSPKDLEDKENELSERLNRVVSDVASGFTNDRNRAAFEEQYQLDTLQNTEKLKGIFRKKYIDNNNANLAISGDRNMKSFIETGNVAYKNNYLADLENSFKAGYISKAEKTRLALQTDDWDKYAAVNAVMQDPDGYLQKIKEGKLKADPETMTAIHSALEKREKLQKYIQEVDDFNTRQQVDSQLDSLELPEALSLLDASQSAYGEKLYKAKRKALLSAHGIDATTQADDHAKLLLEIDAIPKDQGEIEYFKAAKNIEAEIENKYAEGRLSLESRKRLKNKLSAERGKNIDLLKASDDGEKFKFWGFSYKDANDYIKENYSGGNGNNILLDYFNIVSDKNKEISTDEKMSILQSLIDKQMNDSFKTISNRPRVGDVVDGYRYKGGDIHDEKNWEKI